MLHTDDHSDRMWKADSVIAILGRLDLDRLPTHEARAVRESQAKAVDDWLSAYVESRGPAQAADLHRRVGRPAAK